MPQANHRRQKGGRRSAAADPIDEIELLRCSPHADADIEMTKAIVEVARPLGIAVHDHLIVGKDGHASLKALKLI